MMRYRVSQEELEPVHLRRGPGMIRRFHGDEHGLTSISFMISESQPGGGRGMHRHAYEEVFLIHEGRGVYTVGETTIEAGAGDIVIVPAGTPHEFVNTGDGPLRHTAIHGTSHMADLPV